MEIISRFSKFLSKKPLCKSDQLRHGVQLAYSQVATNPTGKHPFPVGRAFAEEIGYPIDMLDSLPCQAYESFTGVSNLSIFARISPGIIVVDLGCGSGLDSYIAARKTGPAGKVVAVDFSESMILKAAKVRAEIDFANIEFLRAAAEDLPLADTSIDLVLVNGIFNLNPYRDRVFNEIFRILKPGGAAFVAELILKNPEKQKPANNLDDWFA